MAGVDGADRALQALVEGGQHVPGRLGRFVDGVVAGDLGAVPVPVGELLPQRYGPVLEVAVGPERGAVGGVVTVPVVILRAGQRVQVDDGVEAVPREEGDDPVQGGEPVLLPLHRPVVVLEAPEQLTGIRTELRPREARYRASASSKKAVRKVSKKARYASSPMAARSSRRVSCSLPG
ncbi:hypothetical protein BEN35_11855 [Streptomyces fradiae]|nr:hypothetical protein BEN35_11855 [Streptomyces fradiae]